MASERGFTLIEVLVAFTIAAMALAVMFQTAGGGLNAVHTAGRYEEAMARAQSHLAAIGRDAKITAGELKGDDGSGYRWRVLVDPVAVSRPPAADEDAINQPVPPWPVSLYKVTVGISWVESGKTRELVLHSERLGQAEHVDN